MHTQLRLHLNDIERRLEDVIRALKPQWPTWELLEAQEMLLYGEYECAVSIMYAVAEKHGYGDQREELDDITTRMGLNPIVYRG